MRSDPNNNLFRRKNNIVLSTSIILILILLSSCCHVCDENTPFFSLQYHDLKDAILFWVTLISSIVNFILLWVAITQLRKQRNDSNNNSIALSQLITNLEALIKNLDRSFTKAGSERLEVLKGLKRGVCEINSQIFNNTLSEIAIKKQAIRSNCNDLELFLLRNQNLFCEGLAIENTAVLSYISNIENTCATLKEMFDCSGYLTDSQRESFIDLSNIMEPLKKEEAFAITKKNRDEWFGQFEKSKDNLLNEIDNTILNVKLQIQKSDA